MHMISDKYLNSAEMDTLTTSRSFTIVITANGEVQTHEEATVYQRIGYILENESHRRYASNSIARKAFRWTRILLRVDQRAKTTSHQKRFSDTCNTENFVPILVRGLSSSSSSSSHPSTSMKPSRQERNYPTSSSSSSTSPTTTVSSDSETRARKDLSGIDSHPVSVSSEQVERKEWWDPFTKPTKNSKTNENEDPEKELGDPFFFRNPRMAARIQTKNSWMTEFLNTETHTPVLLMNRL